MSIEGKLVLEVEWNGKRVTGTCIRSTRPAHASMILEGRLAREARALVPRLYSVCGKAQAAAASLACDFAAGAESPAAAWRECRVIGECAQEYLWRLLLDLPPLLGEAGQLQELAGLHRRTGHLNADIAEEQYLRTRHGAQLNDWLRLADEVERFVAGCMLGMPADEWARCSLDEWLIEGATGTARTIARLISEPMCASEVAPLPWLAAEELKAGIAPALAAGDEFMRTPTWCGRPAETGAWARQRAHPRLCGFSHRGIAARVLARLIELVNIPARLRALVAGEAYSPWVRGAQVAPGVGIAAAETARGTLVHCVALDGARIARWRSVAPTEWNFHPAGAFVRGLAGTEAHSEAGVRRAATLLAHALDPCVGFDVVVHHA